MAQQVLIYRLTGSAAALGVINAIGLIPLIPLALGAARSPIARRSAPSS